MYYRIINRNMSRNSFITSENIKNIYNYTGPVYCITVKNNHNLFAGSNGKFNIIGNCYGGLLNRYFRFYEADLGEAITTSGQELLKFTVYHLDKYMNNNDDININNNFLELFNKISGGHILSGDTDSLFVSIGNYLMNNGKIDI